MNEIPNPEGEFEADDFEDFGSFDDQALIEEDPFEGLRPDWKPTGQRPLPTRRCWYIRPDGTRCKNRGIRGTGLNGTRAVCRYHGGALPAVKKHAQALVEGSRLLLAENTEPAVRVALEIMNGAGNQAAVRLKAAELVLDRGGVTKGEMTIDVTVTQIDAAQIIRDKMKAIADNKAKAAERDEDIVDEAPELTDEGEK